MAFLPVQTDFIRDANVRYHDLAAEHYDAKWGIDYGRAGRAQVTSKLRKALGLRHLGHFPAALEVGAGTGYFGLNLVRSHTIGEYTATDISPGMIGALQASAARLGIGARSECCEASALPFLDDSFDLVFGHAVLHHLPDLEGSLREFLRVLKPGGAIAFCGEPSRYGDRVAALPKRAAYRAAPAWRALVGAGPATHEGFHRGPEEGQLEQVVDVQAFTPAMLRDAAGAAGFARVLVRGEELAASMFGWANRALEATAEPSEVPWLWRQYAYRGYLAFQALDRVLLEPRLPPAIFYNLLVSGRAPG
ncbi:MAG: class I SAM-dependent methyltransferase [Thermoleophilaceae bacterium]